MRLSTQRFGKGVLVKNEFHLQYIHDRFGLLFNGPGSENISE
jgi:hypothetical protein